MAYESKEEYETYTMKKYKTSSIVAEEDFPFIKSLCNIGYANLGSRIIKDENGEEHVVGTAWLTSLGKRDLKERTTPDLVRMIKRIWHAGWS